MRLLSVHEERHRNSAFLLVCLLLPTVHAGWNVRCLVLENVREDNDDVSNSGERRTDWKCRETTRSSFVWMVQMLIKRIDVSGDGSGVVFNETVNISAFAGSFSSSFLCYSQTQWMPKRKLTRLALSKEDRSFHYPNWWIRSPVTLKSTSTPEESHIHKVARSKGKIATHSDGIRRWSAVQVNKKKRVCREKNVTFLCEKGRENELRLSFVWSEDSLTQVYQKRKVFQLIHKRCFSEACCKKSSPSVCCCCMQYCVPIWISQPVFSHQLALW